MNVWKQCSLLLAPNATFHNETLLQPYNSREVHFHLEGNPCFASVPFFYVPFWKNILQACIGSDLSEWKSGERRSAHGLQTRNLLGKGVAEDRGIEAAEKVPL